MSEYRVTARNYSESSENRIHSDEIAKKYGFRGALVPGVAVYGHLTYPLVERLGADWLAHSTANIRLLKPTYDGEEVIVRCHEDNGQYHVTSHSPVGELTAELTSTMPATLPALENVSLLENEYKLPERVEISWNTVVPKQAFPPWEFELSSAENQRYTSEVSDNLELYKNKAIHPHLLLSLANTALTNEYFMPTWIHASSNTRHRQQLFEGDSIVIKSVPLDKWERKGHEFIRLWVTYWRNGEITTDILHTAIYKVAV